MNQPNVTFRFQGNYCGDSIKVMIRMQQGKMMAHGLISDEKIDGFSPYATSPQPLSPLSRLEPITFRNGKLVQTGKVLMKPPEFLPGPNTLQKLKQDRRCDCRLIALDQFDDPFADFRNCSRRKVKQPS